jgi:signal transduction histidine kinase
MATVGGWLIAGLALVVAAITRHSLSSRMEAVARACHELRGPLTAARLGLQLSARTGQLSPARLRAIDLELARAALALDDLGGPSGSAATLRSLEPVDVEELIADSVEAWSVAAAERGVDLRSQWSGARRPVSGDRLRLAQAVGNLIANAIEHGDGPVTVTGSCDQLRIRVEVIDAGPGLAAPVAELARRARDGRGSRGRGLAIASTIAAAHGGRLAAAPAERGARLVLELPAEAQGKGWEPAAG